MQIVLYEIWWYGWLWLAFGALTFCCARLLGGCGIVLGMLLLAIFLYVLDANWIADDMNNHPENGRDMDFVFMFGVLLRAVVFNALLLPVGLGGWWLRRRHRAARLAAAAATA